MFHFIICSNLKKLVMHSDMIVVGGGGGSGSV